MEEFRLAELKRMKNIRAFLFLTIVFLNILLMGYFVADTYKRYERYNLPIEVKKAEINESMMFLLQIEVVLLLFIAPILYLIYNITKKHSKVISDLDTKSLEFFKRYRRFETVYIKNFAIYYCTQDHILIPAYSTINAVNYSDIVSVKKITSFTRHGTRYYLIIKTNVRKYGIITSSNNNIDFLIERIVQMNRKVVEEK